MSILPFNSCPLSGVEIRNPLVNENYLSYDIEFNKHSYSIRLSLDIEVDKISFGEKNILKGMLYNNEWPVEPETIITHTLIGNIIRFGEYPRDANGKLDYYVLKCYVNGGREYKPISFNIKDALDIYAFDDEEYVRLIDALKIKDLIILPDKVSIALGNYNRTLKLSEKGLLKGEELLAEKNKSNPRRLPKPSPKVAIFSCEEDKFYSEKLKDLLLKQYGMSVTSYDDISKDTGYSEIHNWRNEFYSGNLDYAIFIKSRSSDINNTFGSLMEIALEAHILLNQRQSKYVFFAFVDDSDFKARPRLVDYNSECFDARIITRRKYLVSLIQNDWVSKDQKQKTSTINKITFNFPPIPIKPEEEYWLKLLYEKFISNKEENYTYFISKHWNALPKDFRPERINPLLAISGSYITFFGIWSVYPTSKFVKGLEDLILAIREILIQYGGIEEITGDLLKEKLDYSLEDIAKIVTLFSRFDGLAASAHSNENGSEIKIQIRGDRQLNLYKDFTSLEELFSKEKLNASNANDEKSSLNNVAEESVKHINTIIDKKVIDSFKTKFSFRDKNNIDPVLDVLSLSEDISEIIVNLSSQNEKGQMIGVFGKWGRGKSFLLNEVWKKLAKKNAPQFIKIEYHAWKYQETPASWAYLYEAFCENYLGKKSFKYYFRLAKLNFRRNGIRPIVKFLFLGLFYISVSFLIPGLLNKYPILNHWYSYVVGYSLLGFSAVTISKTVFKEFKLKANDLISKYSKRHSYKETLGVQADIQNELIKLLKTWIPEKKLSKTKIVLFVEDIDRCTEGNIIRCIDALRVMLEEEEICQRVIVLAAIDERILKNAIRIKYDPVFRMKNFGQGDEEDLLNEIVNPSSLISEYLDKLFISAIKLGELTNAQRSEYLKALLKNEVEEKAPEKLDKTSTPISNTDAYLEKEKLLEKVLEDPEYIKIMNEATIPENVLEEMGEDDLDLHIEDGDFVIRNGDFALTSSSGNPTTLEEIDEIYKERLSKQNKFEKISVQEMVELQKIIEPWKNSTPRKIRIFYYRYLLCKNILINKYNDAQKLNVWQNKEGIEILMREILNYTTLNNPERIVQRKNEVLASEEKKVKFSFDGNTMTINSSDYIHVLSTLELVIAY